MRSVELSAILDEYARDPAGAAAAIAAAARDEEALERAFSVVLRFGVFRGEQAQSLLLALQAIGHDADTIADQELQELTERIASLEEQRRDLQLVAKERAELIVRIDDARMRVSKLAGELAALEEEAGRIRREQLQLAAVEQEVRKWISLRN